MKTNGTNVTILNHDMVKVVEENNSLVVKIRMRDGRWALQAPFEANQRGIIGALTLSLDVLAGKIMLMGVEAPQSNQRALNVPAMVELTDGKE